MMNLFKVVQYDLVYYHEFGMKNLEEFKSIIENYELRNLVAVRYSEGFETAATNISIIGYKVAVDHLVKKLNKNNNGYFQRIISC